HFVASATAVYDRNRRSGSAFSTRGQVEVPMRLLLGIILGAVLTIGGAYLYDSHQAMANASGQASVQRSMGNWDVVSTKWDHFTTLARAEWNKLRAQMT